MVADASGDDGGPPQFFGGERLPTVAPALLALRFDCDFVPVRIEQLAKFDFGFTVYDLIQADPRATSDRARTNQMMAEMNQLFEQWIQERPQQKGLHQAGGPIRAEPARHLRIFGESDGKLDSDIT